MIGMETNSLPAWDDIMHTVRRPEARESLCGLDGAPRFLASTGGRNQEAQGSSPVRTEFWCHAGLGWDALAIASRHDVSEIADGLASPAESFLSSFHPSSPCLAIR